MDRTELSEAIRQELGAIVAEDLRAAAPELLRADRDGIEARLQQVSRTVCGATLERILAVRAVPRREWPPCPVWEGLRRLVDQARAWHLQGLAGAATVVRPTQVCTRADGGRGHAPLDAEPGRGAQTLLPRRARVVCRAGSTAACDEAAAPLAEDHGSALGSATVRRITEDVGALAEAAPQEEIAPARRGGLERPPGGAADVVVGVDGCQVHLDDAWHAIKVGRTAPAWRAPRRSGTGVYATACRGDLGPQTRRVVVRGAGAVWIGRRAADFVGAGITVSEIVAIFHAYAHLWDAGRAVVGPPAERSAWVEPLTDALHEQGVAPVLAALDALTPPDPTAAEVRRRAQADFADNAARMDDPRFVAQPLPIGWGAVESWCKPVIEARVKGAGMRWSRCAPGAPRAMGRPSGPTTPCARVCGCAHRRAPVVAPPRVPAAVVAPLGRLAPVEPALPLPPAQHAARRPRSGVPPRALPPGAERSGHRGARPPRCAPEAH